MVRPDPGDFPGRVTVQAEFGSRRLTGSLCHSHPHPGPVPGAVGVLATPRPVHRLGVPGRPDAREAVEQARYGIG